MKTVDSPKTFDVIESTGSTKGNTNQSSPHPNHYQHAHDHEQPSTPRVGDYANDLQTEPISAKHSRYPSLLQTLVRSWIVLRYQLARYFFSVPLPFFTSRFDIKVGDLVIVVLGCVSYIVTTAIMAIRDRRVESTGNPAQYGLLVVFLLTIRNSPLVLITGISYERGLFYHKIVAITTIILAGLHGISYLLAHDKGEIETKTDYVSTGLTTFVALVLMFVSSLSFVRRRFFDLFLRSHYILFIIVIVFAIIHGATTALIGIIPWILDLVFRHAYRPRVYAYGSVVGKKPSLFKGSNDDSSGKSQGIIARDQVTMTALPGSIVRIQFPRERKDTGNVFNYVAGQYVFLCIPTISSLQWHPFTISSSSNESMVTFHIKALGDWTSTLYALIAAPSTVSASPFDILVDGPYGSTSIDLDTPSTYSHFALFAGGIGVTPMRAIVNRLYHEARNEGRASIERVHFVWSVRERAMIQAFVHNDQEASEHKDVTYFPNEIGHSRHTAFSSHFYVSRAEHDVELAELDRHVGDCVRYGARPDITDLLRTIGEQAKENGKNCVAVLVCGPSSMVNDVIDKSLMLSWKLKVRFDVHSEVFEL